MVPLSVVVSVALFVVQHKGTAAVGAPFGAVMLLWFGTLAVSGVLNIAMNPEVMRALLIADPKTLEHPFFPMFPNWALYPIVMLSTVAAAIASQAVISGTYSMTWQAIQLGFLPRSKVVQTSEKEFGQIYMPVVNGMLLLGVLAAAIGFGSSTTLTFAYGLAVSGTLLITTVLTFFVVRFGWQYNLFLCLLSTGFFLLIDAAFFSASSVKLIEGLGHGFWRIKGHYGFMETPDVPHLLEDCRRQNLDFDLMQTSFFLNRETILLAPGKGLAKWRGHLFIWMLHLAAKASDYYRIPSNRVIELGTQVQI